MKLTDEQLQRWVNDCKHIPTNQTAAIAKELLLLRVVQREAEANEHRNSRLELALDKYYAWCEEQKIENVEKGNEQ
jgi:predicted YcjX-like family ATPase